MDTTEDVFAQLIAMGFTPNVASAVANSGVGADEAIAMALAMDEGHPQQHQHHQQPPSLRLGSAQDFLAEQQGALAGYAAIAQATPTQPQHQTHQPEPVASEVHSRYREHRKDYIDAAAKVEIEKQRKFKSAAKSEKAQLLQQIAEDRAAKKAFGKGFLGDAVIQSTTLNQTFAPVPSTSPSSNSATIQFRLPATLASASSTLKHAFAAQDKLSIVFLFLHSKVTVPPNMSLQLLSFFPRKVWDESDLVAKAGSIKDAGLTPSASLNVALVPMGADVVVPEPFTSSTSSAPFPVPAIPTNQNVEGGAGGGGGTDANGGMDVEQEEEDQENHEEGIQEDHEEGIQEDHEDEDGEENENGLDDGDDDDQDDDGDHIMGGGGMNRAWGEGVGHVLGGPARARPGPIPAVGRGGGLGLGGGRGGFGRFGRGGAGNGRGGHALGGAGNRLGGDGTGPPEVPINAPAPAADARALRLAAIQNRANAIPPVPDTTNLTIRSSKKIRSAMSLLELALHSTVSLLSQHGNKKFLKAHQQFALRRLGADLAEKVMAAAKTGRKLDRSFVSRLSQCPITGYNLDSYGLATDSLLETIGFTHYLTLDRLSLKGCSIITDEGIYAIQTCKNISHLDLNNCRLTDTIFSYLTSFPYLAYLSLAHTKITSKALKKFAESPSAPHDTLQILILSGCQGITSSGTLLDLSPFTSTALHTLSLQSCPLVGPLVAGKRDDMRCLNVLDVSHIGGLVDEDLTLFSTFPNLLELDLTGSGVMSVAVPRDVSEEVGGGEEEGTANGLIVTVVGFCSGAGRVVSKGLRDVIVRLAQLQSFKLPHKGDTGIDTVVRGFSGLNGGGAAGGEAMHLSTLDLDGFVHLTDYGLDGLSRFKDTLTVLCLSGTQVSNASVREIGELKNLAELNLDRTAIGDALFGAIKEMPLLEVLSLCETDITDLGVKQMNACRFRFTLKRLNLARTAVTHIGIANGLFAYQNLISLNVERSGVFSVEICLNALELESKKGGFRLQDAILSASGVRWAADPLATVAMEEDE
ncbi:UNVERIFIED_CONTAM: hypothetical protein HDU68_008795 [Siphonaria sp. JEL0065]|nr:hypothetical protein HDU68_008795 [Siphonaria sp. JEL0065]